MNKRILSSNRPGPNADPGLVCKVRPVPKLGPVAEPGPGAEAGPVADIGHITDVSPVADVGEVSTVIAAESNDVAGKQPTAVIDAAQVQDAADLQRLPPEVKEAFDEVERHFTSLTKLKRCEAIATAVTKLTERVTEQKVQKSSVGRREQGIALASRLMKFIPSKTDQGRRMLITRSCAIAQLHPDVKLAATKAGYADEMGVLYSLSRKESNDEQLAEIERRTLARKTKPTSRNSTLQVNFELPEGFTKPDFLVELERFCATNRVIILKRQQVTEFG